MKLRMGGRQLWGMCLALLFVWLVYMRYVIHAENDYYHSHTKRPNPLSHTHTLPHSLNLSQVPLASETQRREYDNLTVCVASNLCFPLCPWRGIINPTFFHQNASFAGRLAVMSGYFMPLFSTTSAIGYSVRLIVAENHQAKGLFSKQEKERGAITVAVLPSIGGLHSSPCKSVTEFGIQCDFRLSASDPTRLVELELHLSNTLTKAMNQTYEVLVELKRIDLASSLELEGLGAVFARICYTPSPVINDTFFNPSVPAAAPKLRPIYRLVHLTQTHQSARYLREWLVFHLQLGVEHVFIYDDSTTDNTLQLLTPFIDAGLVTYVSGWARVGFQPPRRQPAGMEDFFLRMSWTSVVVARSDVDQFFLPMIDSQPTDNMMSALTRIFTLRPREVVGTAKVTWQMFGSSGLEKSPPLMTQAYLHRYAPAIRDSFKRPIDGRMVAAYMPVGLSACVKRVLIVHSFIPHTACKGITAPNDVLVMNHYYVRSQEDWRHHAANGWAQWDPEGWLKADQGLNEIEDTRMLFYKPTLQRLVTLPPCLLHTHLPHLAPPTIGKCEEDRKA